MPQHKSYNALRQGASHSHWNRSMSGVNIVAKSPYRFFLSLGETPPEGVFSKEHALHIVHAVCFKISTVQKLLSSSGLGNTLRGFGGKVGNFWALEGKNGGGSDRLKSESDG